MWIFPGEKLHVFHQVFKTLWPLETQTTINSWNLIFQMRAILFSWGLLTCDTEIIFLLLFYPRDQRQCAGQRRGLGLYVLQKCSWVLTHEQIKIKIHLRLRQNSLGFKGSKNRMKKLSQWGHRKAYEQGETFSNVLGKQSPGMTQKNNVVKLSLFSYLSLPLSSPN